MTAAHDTQALAACPFCGGEASRSKTMDESLWTHDTVPYFKVYCSACEIGTDYRCEGYLPSAEEAWNQRASRLQEQEGQPALSERTPKDYAIEHAEYMAVAAERLSDAVNLLAVAHRDEHDDPDIEKAQEAVDESLRAVRDRVYEFRKRRDRATLAAGSQAVQVPGWRLVPVEPTAEMITAAAATPGIRAIDAASSSHQLRGNPLPAEAFATGSPIQQAYRAMLNAAPQQPLAGGEVLG